MARRISSAIKCKDIEKWLDSWINLIKVFELCQQDVKKLCLAIANTLNNLFVILDKKKTTART